MNLQILPSAFRPFLAHMQVVALYLIASASCTLAEDSFQPLSILLQPKFIQNTLPAWETENVTLQEDSDAIDIPIPSLASQDAIGGFALTVVFSDPGDGGPVLEWQPKEGEKMLLSAGLGKTGLALGLNARTVLITPSLALDGGTLCISYTGRFSRLISVTLRPVRELSIAALGSDFTPALLGINEPILTADQISGQDETTKKGDTTEGEVVHAELSAQPKQLDTSDAEDGMEFIVPLGRTPQGSLLQTEVAGLDPESKIEVVVNGESLGALALASFSLNSPSTSLSATGRLEIAGWHPSSLYIPPRLWKEGDNSIVLTLHRAKSDAGQSVYLRKAQMDLLFHASSSPQSTPALSASPSQAIPSATPSSPPPPLPSPETLSTGSVYANPSPSLLHTPAPLSLY